MKFIIYGDLSNEISYIQRIKGTELYHLENSKVDVHITESNVIRLLAESTVTILEVI